MKRYLKSAIFAAFSLSLVMAGCSANNNGGQAGSQTNAPAAAKDTEKPPEKKKDAAAQPKKDLSGEITVWSFWDGSTTVVDFNKVYPKIKVNWVTMAWDEEHQKLKTMLAAGTGAPDVGMVESAFMGDFNNIEGLEDLGKAPFDGSKYKADFTESLWNKMQSLDGKRIWGFGNDNPPGVMFYRSDVFEEAGLPSDPKDVAKQMKDWNEVMKMTEQLKAQGKNLFWYDKQPLDIYLDGKSPFDTKLNYIWNNDEVAKYLDIAKQFRQRKLTDNANMWNDEGKQAASQGKQVGFYIGSWFGGDMLQKQWAGEGQKGKWRVTSLPGGLYNGSGGTFSVIPTQSKNKELAWEWIKWNVTNTESYAESLQRQNQLWVGAYKPTWKLQGFDLPIDYFAGQPIRVTYKELIDKVPVSAKTPFDSKARDIFNKIMDEAIDKNMDSKAALQRAQEDVEKQLGPDIQKLKEKIGLK